MFVRSLLCVPVKRLSKFSFSTKGAVKYLPMPRLSPTMTRGVIQKWYIQPNDTVESNQLILEVSTRTLRDVSSKKSDYIMEVEIIEDMIVADIVAKEGEEVEVGHPIAVFCDEQTDIDIIKKSPVSVLSKKLSDHYFPCFVFILAPERHRSLHL